LFRSQGASRLVRILVLFLVLALSWTIAVRLVWWRPFFAWITSSTYTLAVFAVSLFLVVVNLRPQATTGPAGNRKVQRLLTLAGILVLAWVGLRYEQMDDTYLHNGGMFTGPSELLRQGGWLLWDVPSQYGFLSIL